MTGTEVFYTFHEATSAFFENPTVAAASIRHKMRCHLQHPTCKFVKGEKPPLLNYVK